MNENTIENFEKEVEDVENELGYWHYKSARLRRFNDALISANWWLSFTKI